MSYLLGFPTPIVEVFLTLVVLFLVVAVYLGTRMEGTREIRKRKTVTEGGRKRVKD